MIWLETFFRITGALLVTVVADDVLQLEGWYPVMLVAGLYFLSAATSSKADW